MLLPLKRYSLAFLATTSLITLTEHSSFAFDITFPSVSLEKPVFVKYKSEDKKRGYYGYSWMTVPEPLNRYSPQATGLLSLLSDFSQQQGGNWEFEFASEDLEGRFEIDNYYACGLQTAL